MYALWRTILLSSALVLTPASAPKADPDVESVAVAALIYTADGPDTTACEGDHACAVEALVRRAHAQGARLVAAPEYAFEQSEPEPDPRVGEAPSDERRAPLQARFSRLAVELGLYVIINLETRSGRDVYNTLVAYAPSGQAVAKHHKFELFEGERDALTPGRDEAVFDTEFGRVGLLICADLYGDPRRHRRLVRELGARVVVFSAAWTVSRAIRWQSAFARDWGVYLIGANGSAGDGRGGGVFGPDGQALAASESGRNAIVMATMELSVGSR